MATQKFSEFSATSFAAIKSALVNSSIYLVGVNENNDTNFKLVFTDLMPEASNVGSGAGLYKEITDLKNINLKSIVAGSSKLTVTANTNDVTLDVAPSNITITDLDGTLSLAKGGTGAALTDPGADRILFWDDSAGAITWLTVGDNLSLTATTLSADTQSPLTTKGDIFVYGSADARLPIGTNGYALIANSATSTGLEWQSITTTDEKLKVDAAATAGYLGVAAGDGILRTNGSISWSDGGDYVTLSVAEANLDMSNMDNTTAKFVSADAVSETIQMGGETLAHTEAAPSVGSNNSTGLTFLSNNTMEYVNDISDANKGVFDMVISRAQAGASQDKGARMLFERNEATIASGDVLGEVWFSSNDSAARDTEDGAAGIQGIAVANHDASNRGGYLNFMVRPGTSAPSTSATSILTLNASDTLEAVFAGTIQTSGTSITAAPWELGSFRSGETLGGTTGTIEIEVNGTVYYISAGTTSA